jgi:hypothetical protein
LAGNVIEYITPVRGNLIANHTIDVFSPEMMGYEIMGFSPLIADVTATQNFLFHNPLILGAPFIVSKFFWINGPTVNGNTYMGVYNEDGSALLVTTGAIVNSGSSALQVADITDFTLPPNRRLWLSIGTDGATHTYSRLTLTAPASDYAGIKTMTSGISGSAMVTPATFDVGVNSCIRCGMTGGSVL